MLTICRRGLGIPLLMWRSVLSDRGIVPGWLWVMGERAAAATVLNPIALNVAASLLNAALLPHPTTPERVSSSVNSSQAIFDFGNALFSLRLALSLSALTFPTNPIAAFARALG
ncbi:MAG: hypothetical protein ACK4WM_08235 [Thermoflexales bacterium]